MFPSEFLDLNGILSLVISKISFIPKHFGDKFYQIYSSASLIDPCYFTSTWAIPQADPCTTWLPMRRLVSSPKWRTLASHSPAGALSGRQVLPYTEGCKLTCSGRNSKFRLYAECFSRAKIKWFFNKYYYLF